MSVDLGGAGRDSGGISIGGGTSNQRGGGGEPKKSAEMAETDETGSAEAKEKLAAARSAQNFRLSPSAFPLSKTLVQ